MARASEKNNITLLSCFKEWNCGKNTQDPTKISMGSGKLFWWKCDKGHEWQAAPHWRKRGQGCPYCSGKRPSIENNASNLHCISEWNYEKNGDLKPEQLTPNSHKKIWWICSKRHEWQATVGHRKNGTNCPYCAGNLVTKTNNLTNTVFFQEWNHEKNIDIDPTIIKAGSDLKIWWKCSNGHEWEAFIYNRKAGNGCPYCSNIHTNLEKEGEKLFQVKKYNKAILKNYRYQPDFKLKEDLFINLDGLYWHCELNKSIRYHFNIRKAFEEEDKRILQFYEDEIYQKPLIVKSIVDNILGLNKRIFARKCELKKILIDEAFGFLENNHLIGGIKYSSYLGLYYNNELIMLLSYQDRGSYIDLNRVCTKIGYTVVGGLSRLIKHLPNKKIITLIDLRYAKGTSFIKLGFKEHGIAVNYQYTNGKERLDKRQFRVPAGINEKEEAAKKKFYRIWDAGRLKLIKEPS